MKNIKRNGPNSSTLFLNFKANSGKRLNNIFDPSSGGIGIKLKKARKILIKTAISAIWIKAYVGLGTILTANAITIANRILEIGPAIATNNSPHLWFFRLYGLYGTGFAHPKIKLVFIRIKIPGTKKEPTGSRCLIGLRVNLPAYFAVTSPINKAAYPWATSWITTDNIKMMIWNINRVSITLAIYKYYDSILSHMANKCQITGKKPLVGGGYSNRTRATQYNPTGKRVRKVNLQTKKIFVPELNKNVKVTLSTRAIKTLNKNGAYKTLKEAGIVK